MSIERNRDRAERIAARHRKAMARVERLREELYAAQEKASELSNDFYRLTVNGQAGDFQHTYDGNGGIVIETEES